jgi:hypothetical protein
MKWGWHGRERQQQPLLLIQREIPVFIVNVSRKRSL